MKKKELCVKTKIMMIQPMSVVVWLGFVYSICYTGSFHQLCESVLFVSIVRVKTDFAFMGKKVFAKNKEAVVM